MKGFKPFSTVLVHCECKRHPKFYFGFSKSIFCTIIQLFNPYMCACMCVSVCVQKEAKHFSKINPLFDLTELMSFKILPSTVDTLVSAFFPILECILKIILSDSTQESCSAFSSVFSHLKSMRGQRVNFSFEKKMSYRG